MIKTNNLIALLLYDQLKELHNYFFYRKYVTLALSDPLPMWLDPLTPETFLSNPSSLQLFLSEGEWVADVRSLLQQQGTEENETVSTLKAIKLGK